MRSSPLLVVAVVAVAVAACAAVPATASFPEHLFSLEHMAAMRGASLQAPPPNSGAKCCLPATSFQFNASQTLSGNLTYGALQFLEVLVDQGSQTQYVHVENTHTNLQHTVADVWQTYDTTKDSWVQYFKVAGQTGCFVQPTTAPDLLKGPFCTKGTLQGAWTVGSQLELVWLEMTPGKNGSIVTTTADACIPTSVINFQIDTVAKVLSSLHGSFHSQQLYISDPSKLVLPTGCKPIPPSLSSFGTGVPAKLDLGLMGSVELPFDF